MPHIFEPFFTTKGERDIAAWAWPGFMASSPITAAAWPFPASPGAGTSVRIYLPANDKIVRRGAADLADLRGTQTILMVDDEDLLLTMGQMVLSSYGYTVLTANSGAKALELFGHWKDRLTWS